MAYASDDDLVSFDAAPPEDAWVGEPSTIDGSAEPHPGPRPDPAPAPAPQPSPAPSGEMTNRDDHPAKRASIEGQSADKIRADVLGIAGRLVAAQIAITSTTNDEIWKGITEDWYTFLISVPSWGEDLVDDDGAG